VNEKKQTPLQITYTQQTETPSLAYYHILSASLEDHLTPSL